MCWSIQRCRSATSSLGFLVPVPVGRPPGLNGVGAAVGEAAYPVGEIPLAVGACGDLVGGACPVVAGGDDAAYQLRGVVAGAAAHDVRAVGLLGVFVVAFGDPLIQVGGVGVAAARAGLDGAQRCGRHPGTRSPSSQCARFGEQTATGSGSSAYTSRTALLTKRRAVRSSNHLVTKRA